MRYHLQTLVLLTAIGPPLLAALWFFGPAIPELLLGLIFFLLFLVVGFAMLALPGAVVFGMVAMVAWIFSLVAKTMLYFCVHPDNRR